MSLFFQVYHFVKKNIRPNARLLLAFSGGPDSTALLYTLLEIQKKLSFELELAHVDHKQRKTSSQEAVSLQNKARKLGLIFHLKTLDGRGEGNLEDYFRRKRFSFFAELMNTFSYQALLLGHQREDLEETVLKRFFEGAHLEKLVSMQKKSVFKSIPLWRPLLDVPKKEVLAFLKKKSIPFIQDQTNMDETFLRARLRTSLLPAIEKGFGKNIRSNLVKASHSAALLESYLKQQTKGKVRKNSNFLGAHYHFQNSELHPFEMDFILRKVFEKEQVCLSQDQLNCFSRALLNRCSNKYQKVKSLDVYFDRGHLFIFKNPIPKPALRSAPMKMGLQVFGPWEVEVSEIVEPQSVKLGWRALFEKEGFFQFQIPKNHYHLKIPDPKKEVFSFNRKLSCWFLNHKVPHFLQGLAPVIQLGSEVFTEILTEKTPFVLKEHLLKIVMTFKKR